jgi:hypothetical protein
MAMRDDVLAAVVAMSAEPPAYDRDEAVRRLVTQGYSRLRAVLLVTFVDLGFGRVWIRQLALRPPVELPDTALIWCEGNVYREIRLSDVEEFTEAVAVAEENMRTRIISWEQFARCCGSAEVDCINKTREAGRPVGGGTFSPQILLCLSDAPGFEDWYRGLQSCADRRTKTARPLWQLWR